MIIIIINQHLLLLYLYMEVYILALDIYYDCVYEMIYSTYFIFLSKYKI